MKKNERKSDASMQGEKVSPYKKTGPFTKSGFFVRGFSAAVAAEGKDCRQADGRRWALPLSFFKVDPHAFQFYDHILDLRFVTVVNVVDVFHAIHEVHDKMALFINQGFADMVFVQPRFKLLYKIIQTAGLHCWSSMD
jgi:hypothetical protein